MRKLIDYFVRNSKAYKRLENENMLLKNRVFFLTFPTSDFMSNYETINYKIMKRIEQIDLN